MLLPAGLPPIIGKRGVPKGAKWIRDFLELCVTVAGNSFEI